MTQIAIFCSEASVNSVSLPKRLPKPVNLHRLSLPNHNAKYPDVYSLLFTYCQNLWPELSLQPKFSFQDGLILMGSQVARRLPYIHKDGLRYGAVSNERSKLEKFVFIEQDGGRAPVRIEELFTIHIPNANKPPHVCAIVRRLCSDESIPFLPWDML